MKLLVFAHVPPPHHGQSQMVQHLVDGFRGDPSLGVEVLHVDARLSDDLADVGSARGGKIKKLVAYVREAKRLGREHGVRTLYYVPSPPKRSSLYRDWIALALLRPWFRNVIFHWHAVGLGEWLEKAANPIERVISHRLLDRPLLSIVLSKFNQPDADKFRPRSVAIVPNGIPDPCPDFASTLAPHRTQRLARRLSEGGEVRVLFLALCSRDKGVFDAVEAVKQANEAGAGLAQPLKFRLLVAGTFPKAEDEAAFKALVKDRAAASCVSHAGFLGGEEKAAALRDSDVFLFPSYYANEGQPLSLIEAMAFGLPIVSTRWRGIPEMLPDHYAGLVEPRDPAAAARALLDVAQTEDGLRFRERFLQRYQLQAHLRSLAEALRTTGTE
jgi:glycosyltransferase involved in cell wall biosynthesis